MASFVNFESTGAIPEETLARYATRVPGEIVDLWREWGTGLIGADGFVRIIDPDWYAPYLEDWFENAEDAVVFLATGMGDLLIWKDPVIRHVRYRDAAMDGILPEFGSLFSLLEEESYLDGQLARQPYTAGVERLGVPGPREAFFYAPFVPLGGDPAPENLQRGELATSLDIFARMMGRAEL